MLCQPRARFGLPLARWPRPHCVNSLVPCWPQGGAVSVAVRHVAGRLGRLPSAPSFLPLIAPSAARQTATSWARSGVPGRCGDAFVGARRCYSIVCGAPVVARPVLSRALVWPSRQRASRAPLLLWRRWSSGAPAGGGAKGPEEQGWRQWMLSKDKIKVWCVCLSCRDGGRSWVPGVR